MPKQSAKNLLILGLIFLIIIASGIGFFSYMKQNLYRVSSPDINWISKNTDISWPGSSRLVNSSYREGMQDRRLWALVKIDLKSIDRFIQDLPQGKELHQKGKQDIIGDAMFRRSYSNAPTWWNPDTSKVSTYVTYMTQEDNDVMILIIPDGPQEALVYVFATLG